MGKMESAEPINDFYRLALGDFRGCKQAYYCYLTKATYTQIITLKAKPLNERHATSYYCGLKIIRPKYLRKFAFDTMIEREIPRVSSRLYSRQSRKKHRRKALHGAEKASG